MLLAYFVYTSEIVQYVHAEVVAEIEPRTLLNRHLARKITQAQCLFPAHILKYGLLLGQTRFRLTKHAGILVYEGSGNTAVFFSGIRKERLLLLGYIHQKQRPGLIFVLVADDSLEKSVAVVGLGLPAESAVTSDYKDNRQHSQKQHHPLSAEMHGRNNDTRADKCDTGSKEPAAYHRNDTSDAEHCALATPCPVGKRCSHRNHECDKGCGQRKLKRGAERNQGSGQNKIHRSAHKVERCALLDDCVIHIKALSEPLTQSRRGHAAHPGDTRNSPSHQTTAYARRPEHLVAALLAAETDFCLRHILRFLGCGKRHDHYHSGAD